MHPSMLDPTPEIEFSAKARSLLGSPIVSPSPDAYSFWLIASFARSKLKIDVTNVGHILQSILRGVASDFAVVEVKDWIFRFTMFSHEVGLLIYCLGTISDASFKVSFNLGQERIDFSGIVCVCISWYPIQMG